MSEKNLINLWFHILTRKKHFYLYTKNKKKVKLKILFPGKLSFNNGPDFKNAKIILNSKQITGDIEFHKNSIDWLKHNHHNDENYNNVILHIVLNHNSKIRIINKNNQRVNTLILPKRYKKLFNDYNYIKNFNFRLPCFYLFKRQINQLIVFNKLKLLGFKNFLNKINLCKSYFNKYFYTFNDINKTFNQILYILLFRSLGYSENTYIFEKIANEFSYIEFKNDNKIQDKIKKQNNFKILSNRPCNNPNIRYLQFINLIKNLDENLFNEFYKIFKFSPKFSFLIKWLKEKINFNCIYKIGTERAKIIFYNAVFPVLYFYFKLNKLKTERANLIKILFNIKGFENNYITKQMEMITHLNIKRLSELQQQGIIYVYKNYCEIKDCENCPFYKLLK